MKRHVELTETIIQVLCILFIVFAKNWFVDLVFVLILLFINSRLRMLLWSTDIADNGTLLPLEGIYKRLRR